LSIVIIENLGFKKNYVFKQIEGVLLLSLESLQCAPRWFCSFSTYGVGVGLKRIKPPKSCSHKYNFFAIIFWVKYGHHILNYFFLF